MASRQRPLDLPSPVDLARVRGGLMTQKDMAARIGVDAGQLSRFESGKGEMAYEKIRRYVHVLNLRLTASDPQRFLVERITNRAPLVEVRATDRVDAALEAMVAHDVSQLPVRSARDADEHLGILTEAVVCEAFTEADVEKVLGRPVASLRLAPLDRVRKGDSLQRVAALLASQSLVLVEGDDGTPVGFATRADFFPLVLGRGAVKR